MLDRRECGVARCGVETRKECEVACYGVESGICGSGWSSGRRIKYGRGSRGSG